MKKIVLLILIFLSSCSYERANPQSDYVRPSLYQRIGGKEMLYKISSETLDNVASNPKTKRSFDGVKMNALKESLTNFLCLKTGGDCEYEGETMKNSHADAEISSAEFEIMVQVLREVLDANQVGTKEKNELLKILAPMKRDIVTEK